MVKKRLTCKDCDFSHIPKPRPPLDPELGAIYSEPEVPFYCTVYPKWIKMGGEIDEHYCGQLKMKPS